eukprot:COSAG06_NODE_35473_length_459_cov_2.288889_1_plen_96_part_01
MSDSSSKAASPVDVEEAEDPASESENELVTDADSQPNTAETTGDLSVDGDTRADLDAAAAEHQVYTEPVKYYVLATATVRAGPDPSSDKVGEHKQG